jgi:hypothetical protein
MASSLTISASIAAMLEDRIEPTPGVSIGAWFDRRDERPCRRSRTASRTRFTGTRMAAQRSCVSSRFLN